MVEVCMGNMLELEWIKSLSLSVLMLPNDIVLSRKAFTQISTRTTWTSLNRDTGGGMLIETSPDSDPRGVSYLGPRGGFVVLLSFFPLLLDRFLPSLPPSLSAPPPSPPAGGASVPLVSSGSSFRASSGRDTCAADAADGATFALRGITCNPVTLFFSSPV